MGEPVVTVARNRRVTMCFGIAERANHPLGGRQVEEILRYVRPGGDRATKEFPCPLLQPEQAEHSAHRVKGVRRLAKMFGRSLRRRAGLTSLTGHE